MYVLPRYVPCNNCSYREKMSEYFLKMYLFLETERKSRGGWAEGKTLSSRLSAKRGAATRLDPMTHEIMT